MNRSRTPMIHACTSLLLILAGRVAAQSTPEDMEKMKQRMLASGAGHEFAAKQFIKLPKGTLYLRLENFPTREAAYQAETPVSASLEWAGKIWLFTLAPKGERSRAGTLVAEIGPVPAIPSAARYVMEINEANLGPETNSETGRLAHTHPGPEIFYLLTGEQCLETPNGAQRARAGEGMVAPANTPMVLNIMGSSKRDGFFVVIHDSNKPGASPSDWQPKGACK